MLCCVECGAESEEGHGWRALLTDEEEEPAFVAVYCPACAAREFDD